MDRIQDETATADHKFKEAMGGSAATRVRALWLNGMQEELASFIEEEGITLSAVDLAQLRQATDSRYTITRPLIEDIESMSGARNGQPFSILGGKGQGRWLATTADISAEVALDPLGGVYRPFLGGDGSLGGLIRDVVKGRLHPSFFGADPTGAGIADSGFNACTRLAALLGYITWIPRNHTYTLTHNNNPLYSNTEIDGDYGTIKLVDSAGAGGNTQAMLTGANETDGSTYPATRISNVRIGRVILDGNRDNQDDPTDYLVGFRFRAIDGFRCEGTVLQHWNRWGGRVLGDLPTIAGPFADIYAPVDPDDAVTDIRFSGIVARDCGDITQSEGSGPSEVVGLGAAIQANCLDGFSCDGFIGYDVISGVFLGACNKNCTVTNAYYNWTQATRTDRAAFSVAQGSDRTLFDNLEVINPGRATFAEACRDTEFRNVRSYNANDWSHRAYPSSLQGEELGLSQLRYINCTSHGAADNDIFVGAAGTVTPDVEVINFKTVENPNATSLAMTEVDGLVIKGGSFIGDAIGGTLTRCENVEIDGAALSGDTFALQCVGGGEVRLNGGRLDGRGTGGIFRTNFTSDSPTGKFILRGFKTDGATSITTLGGLTDHTNVLDWSVDGEQDAYSVTLAGATVNAGAQATQSFAITEASTRWGVSVSTPNSLRPLQLDAYAVGGTVYVVITNASASNETFSDTDVIVRVNRQFHQ